MTPINYDHPDFAAFCSHWEVDGLPPLPLADWLRERDYENQADAIEVIAKLPFQFTPYPVHYGWWTWIRADVRHRTVQGWINTWSPIAIVDYNEYRCMYPPLDVWELLTRYEDNGVNRRYGSERTGKVLERRSVDFVLAVADLLDAWAEAVETGRLIV